MKVTLSVLLTALLLVLSFPPFSLGFLAWFALIPLFVTVKGKSPGFAFLVFYLSGIGFLMGFFYWINIIKGFDFFHFLLLGIYLGFYFAVFGVLMNFISRKLPSLSAFAAPVLWVSLEYARSHAGFLGLPWAIIAHTQYRYPPVIQITSVTGTYGVSFLIVMGNAAIAAVVYRYLARKDEVRIKEWMYIFRPALVPLLVVGISLGYGFHVISGGKSRESVPVTIIQGNISQEIKWDPAFLLATVEKHVMLTEKAVSENHTSLIVWPETSIPGNLPHNQVLLKKISGLAKGSDAFLLVGSSQRPKVGPREYRKSHWWNSAYFISPQGRFEGQYNKIHLLPFAEYLPYRDAWPWPSSLASMAGHFTPGDRHSVFTLEKGAFGVLICWESIFPDLVREFVNNGAQFLVNITNEAWFGETAAPYQFLSMNVFRAVENRVAIARAANTGISCFISPFGEVTGRVTNGGKDIFVEGYLTQPVPLSSMRTFYTLYGDVFAYLNLLAAMLLLVVSFLRGDRMR